MPTFILSTNMNLPVPIPGQESGPQWAVDINDCLGLLDEHDHTNGRGVKVTPGGLNINAELSINSNDVTLIRSARFASQLAILALPADRDCLYDVNGDLYFNNASGFPVQITIGNAVAGTPGSIAGLVSPASVVWDSLSSSFIFQSTTNTAAILDCRSVILRNATAFSYGLELKPPTLSADATITLPPIAPVTTRLAANENPIVMDPTGNMSASVDARQSFCPIGTVLPFAGSAAPSGWLLCNGAAISETTYAELFAVIGTAYNDGGEGAGNFRIPNLEGRVPAGAGAIGISRGSYGGENVHTLSQAEMPVHNHGVTDPMHYHAMLSSPYNGSVNNGAAWRGNTSNYGDGVWNSWYQDKYWESYPYLQSAGGGDLISPISKSPTNISITNAGLGGSHNNMQPYTGMNFIIKY